MKTVILIACLFVAANAEPSKTHAGLEQEAVKSQKLQFEPADAQVYTGRGREVVVGQSVDRVDRIDTLVPQTIVSAVDQYTPGYYSPAAVPAVGVWGPRGTVVPYSSQGQTTVTTQHQNGLPIGSVWEHHGTTHVGHAAHVPHVRRPAHLLNPLSPLYTQTYSAGGAIIPGAVVPAGAVAAIPAHLIPDIVSPYQGQIDWVNGQKAQYINGVWYYVDAAAAVSPLYSSVYTNLYNRPAYPGKAFLQPQTWAQPAVVVGQRRPTLIGAQRPLEIGVTGVQQDNKWYTKTNAQPIGTPFYATRPKQQFSAQKPDSEAEKADWAA